MWVQIVIFPAYVWCQIVMGIIGQNPVPGCSCLTIFIKLWSTSVIRHIKMNLESSTTLVTTNTYMHVKGLKMGSFQYIIDLFQGKIVPQKRLGFRQHSSFKINKKLLKNENIFLSKFLWHMLWLQRYYQKKVWMG